MAVTGPSPQLLQRGHILQRKNKNSHGGWNAMHDLERQSFEEMESKTGRNEALYWKMLNHILHPPPTQ